MSDEPFKYRDVTLDVYWIAAVRGGDFTVPPEIQIERAYTRRFLYLCRLPFAPSKP